MQKNIKKNKKIKYPIALKLILIISILVVISLGTITVLVTVLIGNNNKISAEDNNHTVNEQAAAAAEKTITNLRRNAFLLMDMLNAANSSSVVSRQASVFYFDRNPNIAALFLTRNSQTSLFQRNLLNNKFFISNELDSSLIMSYLQKQTEKIKAANNGETQFLNATPFFNTGITVMMYPYNENGQKQSLIIFFSNEELSDIFGSSNMRTTYLVNYQGDILAHPDYDKIYAGENVSNSELFKDMVKNGNKTRQILFNNADGKQTFGSYTKLSIGDLSVFTIVSAALIYEPVVETTKKNLLLSASVLFIAILFIWFFSKSISKPIKKLTVVAHDIEKGNYDIQLQVKSKDEVGLLTESFVSMSKGLAEREHLKDAFGRFTNQAVAERAVRGELKLGGETKQATIFFSDIRNFTAISEKLTPEEVVGFLNNYMTRMVDCVNKTNGVVDKYIGDAIMCLWGTPTTTGIPATDALNCVRAALMMRHELIEFNKNRDGSEKQPIIRIGCGINTGPVVAGQIGSNKRMEYTCIGDAVNFASRTESLNKPLGTDILITENTYELVKDHVLVKQMPSVTVKGKSKPVKLFAVLNLPEEDSVLGCGVSGPKTIEEVRSIVGIPIPQNEGKVNLNDSEKKYKILGD